MSLEALGCVRMSAPRACPGASQPGVVLIATRAIRSIWIDARNGDARRRRPMGDAVCPVIATFITA